MRIGACVPQPPRSALVANPDPAPFPRWLPPPWLAQTRVYLQAGSRRLGRACDTPPGGRCAPWGSPRHTAGLTAPLPPPIPTMHAQHPHTQPHTPRACTSKWHSSCSRPDFNPVDMAQCLDCVVTAAQAKSAAEDRCAHCIIGKGLVGESNRPFLTDCLESDDWF